jgi:hypothetical protein
VHATDYLAARLGRGRAAHLELGRATGVVERLRAILTWWLGKAPRSALSRLKHAPAGTWQRRNPPSTATRPGCCAAWHVNTFWHCRKLRMKFASMSCQFITRLNSRWIFSFSVVLLVGIESSESDRWASPIVFSPGTLRRTWGTRRFPQRRLGLGVFVFFVPGHLNGFELGLIGL